MKRLFTVILIVFIQVFILAETGGIFSSSSNKAGKEKAVAENSPQKYSLSQNYPNPFNPETTIKFNIENEGLVTLTVYNLIGQDIKTLVSEVMSAGEHQVSFNASSLTSGIYLYKLTAGSYTETKRMVLMK